jgi:hypothetical protein
MLVIVAALLACWLVLRGAWIAQWTIADPALAARAWPASGDALAGVALRRTVAASGIVDGPGRDLVARAMARAPGSALPLAIAGFDASASGALARATQLMEAARARNPRLLVARAWLLNEYTRDGRDAEALGEAGVVMRFAPDTRPQIYRLIAQIAARPGGRQAVQDALAGNPDWREPYLQSLGDRAQGVPAREPAARRGR